VECFEQRRRDVLRFLPRLVRAVLAGPAHEVGGVFSRSANAYDLIDVPLLASLVLFRPAVHLPKEVGFGENDPVGNITV